MIHGKTNNEDILQELNPSAPWQHAANIKVYIAGKVSGLPLHEVTMKFGTAQKELEALGFEVVNPMQVVHNAHMAHPVADKVSNAPWAWCMRHCLSAMLSCHAVVMLKDWPMSAGASLERYIAMQLSMPVYNTTADAELRRLGSLVASGLYH
jgi:hypothetical protein